jgi:hypothetical protein
MNALKEISAGFIDEVLAADDAGQQVGVKPRNGGAVRIGTSLRRQMA